MYFYLQLLIMVNVEKFAERLNKIMDFYEITAGNFADKIEVQRSSISHILSGRNKPSLDFVLKVLKEFPEVELYWLLNGTGTFPKQKEIKPIIPPTQNSPSANLFSKSNEESIRNLAPTFKNIENNSDKEIERIVVFYTDGTFKNYYKS